MIPYDDLVVALTTWRARQGLPVGQMSGALSMPAPEPAPAPAFAAPTPGSGGARTQPPVAPPRGTGNKAAVAAPVLETHDESLDVDDAALLEETHYENEGSDFAMAFAGEAPRDESESTAIGNMPLRDSFSGGETLLDSDLDAGGATEDSLGGKPPGNKPGW